MDRQKNEVVVPELAADLQTLRATISNIQGAFRNRAYDNRSNTATAGTAGQTNNVAAVLIQARVSGIFAVTWALQYSGATAAAANSFGIVTQSNTVPITLTSVNAVEGQPGTGTNPMTAGSAPGIFTSSAAGGIAVTGGPFNASTRMSETFTTATGQTTGTFAWSGNVDAGAAGIPVGNFAAILFTVNSTTSAVTLTSMSISVVELPL